MSKPPKTLAWDSVVLVCEDCRRRSNGPRKTKPQEVVVEVRKALRAERPRPRTLLTGCLGLCPKRATAIARVGAGHGGRIVAVERLKKVRDAVAQLSVTSAPDA